MACVQLWHQRSRQPASSGGAVGRRATTPILLLPRNAHKSVYHAMVLSGAEPCWLTPEYDAASGLCLGVSPATIEAALARCGSGASRVAAVLLVSPTYEGVLSDVGSAAALCREVCIPLIVDEAHGAHLHFMSGGAGMGEIAPRRPPSSPPSSSSSLWELAVPRGAIHEGADLAVQSTHKTLGAMTQAAMLHASASALSPTDGAFPELENAISSALEMVQSSSPSYLLLASLDAARHQMAAPNADGRARLLRAAHLAADLRAGVRDLHDGPRLVELAAGAGVHALDPLRVTLLMRGEGRQAEAEAVGGAGGADAEAEEATTRRAGGGWSMDGFELDEALISDGVYAELPQAHTLTLALSGGSERAHVRRLLRSLRRLSGQAARGGEVDGGGEVGGGGGEALPSSLQAATRSLSTASSSTAAKRALTPRAAHFSPRRVVPADDAVGMRSAELVCPYPPGIPLLVPGERISAEALAELRALRDAGCSMTGCTDTELESLAVLVDQGERENEEAIGIGSGAE